MNAFQTLRKQAKLKLDAAVKLANRDFETTSAKIDDLERLFGTGSQPATFIAMLQSALAYQERPAGAITLVEAMQSVLRKHGPLRKIEICVHSLELGYQTAMTQKAFSSYVGKLLRTKPHLFKREGVKWMLVG